MTECNDWKFKVVRLELRTLRNSIIENQYTLHRRVGKIWSMNSEMLVCSISLIVGVARLTCKWTWLDTQGDTNNQYNLRSENS